jgi:hypothetical protein
MALESREQCMVRAAVINIDAGRRPRVHDVDRGVGMRGIPGDVPAQRVLISRGRILHATRIVLGAAGCATAPRDGRDRIGHSGTLRKGAGHQLVPAAFPRLDARCHLRLHSIEIRLPGQHTRMNQGGVSRVYNAERQQRG